MLAEIMSHLSGILPMKGSESSRCLPTHTMALPRRGAHYRVPRGLIRGCFEACGYDAGRFGRQAGSMYDQQ